MTQEQWERHIDGWHPELIQWRKGKERLLVEWVELKLNALEAKATLADNLRIRLANCSTMDELDYVVDEYFVKPYDALAASPSRDTGSGEGKG